MSLATRISITRGDIVGLDVDCIVNAANERLQHGGGVCGAIFEAAGPRELQAECDSIGGCPTGSAVITKGYRLKPKWVIHAVGPIFTKNPAKAPALLKSTYLETLKICVANGIRSVALPSISTGIYGYPIEEACAIAIEAALEHCSQNTLPEQVVFCCFSAADLQQYQATYKRLTDC